MTFPMDPSGGIAGGAAAASANVTTDIPCRKCGYNLRGMAVSGRCPECGTPVGVSVHGDLLRFSDPEFVLTLRKGVSLILWGILIMILVMVIGAIAGGMTRGASASSPYFKILGLIGYLPMLWGAWLLTTPDPSGIREDRYGTPRKIIRFALAVGVANFVLGFAIGIAGPLAPAIYDILITLSFLASIIGLVGQFAQLFYLHKLALRIPDPSLSERARFLMWAIGICYGLLLVLGFIMLLTIRNISTGRPGMGGAAMGAGCFSGILGIAVIVFGVMYIFMLVRFGRSFDQQAAFARQLWAGGAAPPPVPPVA
ncbi:MAG TPA: hypothetical protein VFC78_15300 [Tepidisphaeraceae bacterium]|nr:hypothetical protein [Tepidisphaeraceae bacterium]